MLLSTEKPQAKEETDHENEQSYVDVFDLHIRNSVSDIHIPLPGNELTLGVQRVLTSEIYGTHPGIKPWEAPDKPFGECWNSNLCPHIRFGFKVTDKKSEPDWVDVIDENGTSYRFVLIWKRDAPTSENPNPPALPHFLPVASNRTEQDNYLCSLTAVNHNGDFDPSNPSATMEQWGFVFRRKFGTLLTFEATAITRQFRLSNKPPPAPPTPPALPPVDPVQFFWYSRLTKVEDRFGNSLSYELDAVDQNGAALRVGGVITGKALCLLPSRIVSDTVPSTPSAQRTISITSERVQTDPSIRRVLSVTDPNSSQIIYSYATTPLNGVAGILPLKSVKRTGSHGQPDIFTTYAYNHASQTDTAPIGLSDQPEVFYHINLAGITDAGGKGFEFAYTHDLSLWGYNSEPDTYPTGWYLKAGLRKRIFSISSTSGWVSSWTAALVPANPAPNLVPIPPDITTNIQGKAIGPVNRTVVDAEGNVRYWVYDAPIQFDAKEVQKLLFPTEDAFRNMEVLLLWTRLTVHHPLLFDGAARISEVAEFDPEAGLAPLKVTDFCGNVSRWEYGDSWHVSQLTGLGWLSSVKWFFSKFPDPTKQIRERKLAGGGVVAHERSFQYCSTDPNLLHARVMKKITDEEGRVTEYVVDSNTGNRTLETVSQPAGTPGASLTVRETAFAYHSLFKGFLTERRTVAGLILAGGSAADQVVTYTPDAKGYTAKEIQGLEGSAGEFGASYSVFDNIGNLTQAKDGVGNLTDFVYDSANRLVSVAFSSAAGVIPPAAATRSINYDSRGNKLNETDERGFLTSFNYDDENRLTVVTRQGVSVNPITSPGATANLVTSYLYNRLGSRLQSLDPEGNATRWIYDPLQRPITMLQWKDKSQTPAFTLPDPLPPGQAPVPPSAGQEAGAYVTRYHYQREFNCGHSAFDSASFKPTLITHPKKINGQAMQSKTVFDSLYRLIEERHEYQPGVWTQDEREYDMVGNLTKASVLEKTNLWRVTLQTYDAENRPLQTTVRSNALPTDPDQLVTSKVYTAAGLIWKSTNERGGISEMRYDLAGRQVRSLSPDPVSGLITGNSPSVAQLFDAAGNLIRMTNPLGNVWDYEYDFRNRKTVERQPATTNADDSSYPSVRAFTVTGYDVAGNVTTQQDARGNVTTTTYDEANRPWKVTAPAAPVHGVALVQAAVTTTLLDKNGNALEITDPEGNTTSNQYDGLNRPTQTTVWPVKATIGSPGVSIISSFVYDEAGNRTHLYDGEGHLSTFQYDGINRLTHTTFDFGTAYASTTEEVWGPLLKLRRIEPGNRITEYEFDFNQRLTKLIYGTNHQENRTYSYDATGNLLSTIYPNAPDALAHTYAQYDFLNRVTSEVSAGQTHHYSYDKAGNRLQTTYRGGRTLICTYDALNRLATCSETLAGSGIAGRVTRYLYDLDGHTRYKQLPGGVLEERRWDTRGRCHYQATSPPPATVVWPPGPVNQGGAFITHHWYHFDNVGNIRFVVENTSAGGNASLAIPQRDILNTYDGTYRLLEESITIHASTLRVETTGYTYDKAGNRTGMTRNYGSALENGATTYLYGDPLSTDATVAGPSNQVRVMLRPGGSSVQYQYDLHGCRNRRWVNAGAPVVTPPVTGVDGFEYDRENRLKLAVVAAAAPPGVARVPGQHTYRYDARTRRVARVVPGNQVHISFSGGLSVQEYTILPAGSSSGTGPSSSSSSAALPDVEYIRSSDYGGGIGGILYTLRGGVASCQHYNHRGDVIAKTTGTSAAPVEWTAAYTAFGTRPEEHGTNSDPHRANTKEEDGTGLLNEGHRYRCLETGMFITRDPAGFIDGPNLYAYVAQNPWSKFDPEGLSWWDNAKSFGWGVVKGAAIAAAVVVAVAAAPLVLSAAAVSAVTTVVVAVGVAATAKTGYEIISGEDAFTGEELSQAERWERAGELVGGGLGGAAAGRAAPGLVAKAARAAGKADSGAFEVRVGNAAKSTHKDIQKQVQIKPTDGEGRVTPDFVGTNKKTGKLEPIEAKSTERAIADANAGNTKQARNYETLAEKGGQVRSKDTFAPLKYKNPVPPMQVQYVGPKRLYQMENPKWKQAGYAGTGGLAPNSPPKKKTD